MAIRTGRLLGVLATAWLAGCGTSETASLIIDGPDTALTLERVKPYVWSDGWELQLVVRRFPECQRRHNLTPTKSDSGFKMDLYSPAPGAIIIQQGKRWYVTELKSCELQAFKAPPPEPGTRVGSFIEKDGELRFEQAPQAVQPAAPEPGSATPPGSVPGQPLPPSTNT